MVPALVRHWTGGRAGWIFSTASFLRFLHPQLLQYEAGHPGHSDSGLQVDSTLLSAHGQQLWPVTRKANAGLSTRVWTRAPPTCLLPGPREGRQAGPAAGDFTQCFSPQAQPTVQMKTFSLHPLALAGSWFPVSDHISIRSNHIQLSLVGQK